MPEPNDTQRATLAALKDTYGRDNVKGHATDAATGNMRVELKCLAGMWQWYFDTTGTLVDKHLTARLFDPPPPVHIPRNAIDN
jgi:hypothetical protein